jgi:hypothetical protein
MPKDYDVHVKTAQHAINIIKTGCVTHISFDHDLGDGNGKGYDVASHIEQAAYCNEIPRIVWDVHSQNVPGTLSISLAMRQADKFWQQNEMAKE